MVITRAASLPSYFLNYQLISSDFNGDNLSYTQSLLFHLSSLQTSWFSDTSIENASDTVLFIYTEDMLKYIDVTFKDMCNYKYKVYTIPELYTDFQSILSV